MLAARTVETASTCCRSSPSRRSRTARSVARPYSSKSVRLQIGDAGFTQYRKIGKGVYEKTAGKGPGIIRGD